MTVEEALNELKDLPLDAILYTSRQQWNSDKFEEEEIDRVEYEKYRNKVFVF